MIALKAGQAKLDGKAIVADAQSKGIINCFPMADPGLVQFLFSAEDGTVIDELILMPFDAEVKQAGGYLLVKFESSSAKYFYWMREKMSTVELDAVISNMNSTKYPVINRRSYQQLDGRRLGRGS